MQYQHKNEYVLNRLERIDIRDYVRTFLVSLTRKESGKPIKLNSVGQAERIKGLLNIPKNTLYKSFSDLQTGIPYWNKQLVDYKASNLGKGYIFYFLCGNCNQKAKYLYEYTTVEAPLCRKCCRVTYRRSGRSSVRY